MNIIAIIPARSGSKSIKDKNIRLIGNKPMIAFSIEQALKSKYINRVIVSTDSPKYKRISEEFGAEVPFLRPKELSLDNSLDLDVFKHAIEWLKTNENYEVDICVHLRPTHPIRIVEDIDKMIDLIIKNESIDSVRSVSLAKDTPYKMWYMENNFLTPILNDIPDAYNKSRQSLPKVFLQNASIDVTRASTIQKYNSMTGKKIMGYEMLHNFDIDEESDFLRADLWLTAMNAKDKKEEMKIVCDIDGIIATKIENNDYTLAQPMEDNISIINQLYNKGHKIVLFTARGYTTGINWRSITIEQLAKWGVKYDDLIFEKPNADFYIDDKFINLKDLNNIL